MAAPQRELTEEEVLSIFEHVHHNRSLPPCLQYQVIPVDPKGSKISPPRFNFSDGLFLLCDTNHPHLPKHLLERVCRELPKSASFHWHPAKKDNKSGVEPLVQMRNCYRYREEGNIGGPKAYIWTKLVNGGKKEDLQYRLIHVLSGKFSAPKNATRKEYIPKRLKTTTSSTSSTAIPVAPPPPRRVKQKQQPPPARLPVPPKRKTSIVKPAASSKTPTACLTEEQVKAVFDSVHNNTKPPPNLKYQVIAIESDSSRISPPRLKYNDGIYILCDTSDPTLSLHLKALVGTRPPAKEGLRWNVSGMATAKASQYSRRHVSALNYKNERFPDYSKNATMWSQLVDGEEDMKCRVFHVFPRDADVICKKQGSANRVASSRIASRKQETKEDGCQVCGKQDNCDSLMECDGCASRYCHTFCLGLTSLPEGDWFCKTCMPRKPPKKRPAPNGLHGAPGPKKSRSSARAVSPVAMDTLMEEETTKAIHFKIMSRQKASGDADSHIGFLAVCPEQSEHATFTDIRAMIHDELDPESLPQGGWKFVVPTLGPIGHRQESTLGPVVSLYKRAFEGRLGDGHGWNPFELTLMTSPLEPMNSS